MVGLTSQQRLVKAIMAIQADPDLNDEEKAKKRQELMSGRWSASGSASHGSKVVTKGGRGGKRQARGMLLECILVCYPWIH